VDEKKGVPGQNTVKIEESEIIGDSKRMESGEWKPGGRILKNGHEVGRIDPSDVPALASKREADQYLISEIMAQRIKLPNIK
jgi:hypothetical protein